MAFLGAKNGWMAVCQPPGGWLRNANFGCQLGTSWGGIGRGKVRERGEERRGLRFCGLPLSLRQISSSSEFFGFVSNVVASSPLRLDVSIQLFLSPRRSLSMRSAREEEGGGRGVHSRDPNPFCIHPRKSSAAVSIYHRRRDASATILSDLLPVLLSRFPWHTVMKIYREALPGMGSSSE